MTHAAPLLILLGLLPSAALKPPPIPAPGPAPSEAEAPPPLEQRLPIEQRAPYRTFEKKCGRCHSHEKALAEAYTAEQWDEYLRRKMKRAGAGISERQLTEISGFLRFWSTAKK